MLNTEFRKSSPKSPRVPGVSREAAEGLAPARAGKFLPYFAAALIAVAVVAVRWLVVDDVGFFVTNAAAPRPFYALFDMSFDDGELTEKLRSQVADSIVGVLVKGSMRSDVGFDDECEILLNQPLSDTLLPQELREMLEEMSLDRRELLIATVRSIREDLLSASRPGGVTPTLNKDERDEFIWQRISMMESDPSAGNIIFQILSTLSEADEKIDPHLTSRVREMASADIVNPKKFYYAGDLIVERGEIVTPQIARVLRLQGYPEGRFPTFAAIFSVVVACACVFWLDCAKSDRAFLRSGAFFGDRTYPFFLLVLGWIFELGGVCIGFDGLGVFPVLAIIFLTLPNGFAQNCAAATALSASLFASGYDVAAFAVNSLAGCAGVLVGGFLLSGAQLLPQGKNSAAEDAPYRFMRRNFSRSAVWLNSLLLGCAMFFVAEAVKFGITHSLVIRAFSDGEILSIATSAIGVILLSLVVIVLLPLLETVFDIVSPLQLVELTQPSQPLLRRLQVEAPGTYNHCQMVGNLAEAAAERIGLNPMLLRAGACFHDIGKLKRPGLFVENQAGVNEHDEMSPAMSAMIILSHVKDGLELAEENHLPSQITAFIAEHHGTACLTYFYKKALQAGLNVEESQFCYPGPKPQSRETGVLMLADSTEAAARSASANLRGLHDLTRLVDDVVRSKIEAGQLDDVAFTFSDLTEIKRAMVRSLSSMYHTRNIKPLPTDDQNQSETKVKTEGKL